MEARRQLNDIQSAGRQTQPRILYVANLYFKNEGRIKTFPNK